MPAAPGGPSESDAASDPRLDVERDGDALRIRAAGRWSLVAAELPSWEPPDDDAGLRRVALDAAGVEAWDGSLLVVLVGVRRFCEARGLELEERLPPRAAAALEALDEEPGPEARVAPPEEPSRGRLSRLAAAVGSEAIALVHFLGGFAQAVAAIPRRRTFLPRELAAHVARSGPAALPVVSLIGLLVGVIVTFQGAIQLRDFGADIFVVDLTVLSVLREMGPVMTGVVLAGRTGTAFAAQIGSMVFEEEVDALRTMGVEPIGFLALPRVLALTAMAPLLTIYADAFGVLGGIAVAWSVLGVPMEAFLVRAEEAAGAADLAVGLVKSVCFGLLVSLAACYQGLRARRSSTGIGAAATSAAVAGILLVVAADALFGEVLSGVGL